MEILLSCPINSRVTFLSWILCSYNPTVNVVITSFLGPKHIFFFVNSWSLSQLFHLECFWSTNAFALRVHKIQVQHYPLQLRIYTSMFNIIRCNWEYINQYVICTKRTKFRTSIFSKTSRRNRSYVSRGVSSCLPIHASEFHIYRISLRTIFKCCRFIPKKSGWFFFCIYHSKLFSHQCNRLILALPLSVPRC